MLTDVLAYVVNCYVYHLPAAMAAADVVLNASHSVDHHISGGENFISLFC